MRCFEPMRSNLTGAIHKEVARYAREEGASGAERGVVSGEGGPKPDPGDHQCSGDVVADTDAEFG